MVSAPDATPVSGGCQCGAARYVIAGAPLALYVCHCRECRKQSASAFGISLIVRRADFRLGRGAVARWSRRADSGRTLICAFCPACGSRLWHEGVDPAEPISVKGGSLDTPPDLGHAIHIWTARKLPGVIIPARARQFPGEPE
ncbi:MAG: hypothetical protein K0S96_2142 [Geminicoccaceae bacterium]|nr:hypothetical protein [Geminicoccaceae bacterium]